MLQQLRVRVGVSLLVASLFLVAVYASIVAILPAPGFFVADQGVKFIQIHTLAKTGSLSIEQVADSLSPMRPSFAGIYFGQHGSEYYCLYPPIYAAVVLPFYQVLGERGLVIPGMLGSLAAAYFTGKIAEILGLRRPWLIMLVVGLASPFAFYAGVLWEHSISVAFLCAALYLALSGRSFVAGLAAAVAFWFRPEAYLFPPAVSAAYLAAFGLLPTIRFVPLFAAGVILGGVPLWLFNFNMFGSIMGLHVTGNLDAVGSGVGVLEYRLWVLQLHLVPVGWRKWLALLCTVGVLATGLRLMRRSLRPALCLLWVGTAVIGLIHMAQWRYIDGPFTYEVNSITDGFPFILAGLASVALVRKEPRLRFLAAYALVFSTAMLYLVTPPGGQWGPRFLLPVYPALAILAWVGLSTCKGRLERPAVLTLLAFSVVIQLMGVGHLYAQQQRWATLNRELTSLEPRVVATSVWWLPFVAASTMPSVEWAGARNIQDVERLGARTERFWWVWSLEDQGGFQSRSLSETGALPLEQFRPLAYRTLLPTRHLQAVLYEVIR